MKRAGLMALLGLGIVLFVGGLLFLCAAVREPARLVLALVLLGVGGGLAVGTLWWLRQEQQLQPHLLADSILALAHRSNSEVTAAQVVAELHVPAQAARQALAHLEREGQARREWRTDREVYTFPGLAEGLVIRRCLNCGTEFSVAEPLYQCPNCGGQVKVVRQ